LTCNKNTPCKLRSY